MKIVAISDTHEYHRKVKIPKCDVLVHAGDATAMGNVGKTQEFLKWMSKQPANFMIFVPGNHDLLFEKDYHLAKQMCDDSGIILLIDESVVIEGVKFHGSPVTPWFCDWAFNRIGFDIQKHWDLIPEDTDILITHGPSKGSLDTIDPYTYKANKLGCPYLKNKIEALNLKYHIHGHIHGGYGTSLLNNTILCNVSICNELYIPINPPTQIEYK